MRFLLIIGFLLCSISLDAGGGRLKQKEASQTRALEVVFCFDLSGSTNGLIEDFREHFWYMVNQMQAMQPAPVIRIGLVGFSRPSFGKNNAYIKVLSDITPDLDAVVAQAFDLRRSIEKGDQFVVPALQTCLGLNWDRSATTTKMIIIVGNGMANANGMAYEKISQTAASKGITINTLYVSTNGIRIKELPAWRRIADLSGGMTTEIRVNPTDSAMIWNSIPGVSVKHNEKLVQSLRWNVMQESCREYTLTCDSGALKSNPNEWLNRLAYKSSAGYYNYLQRCGAFSTHDGRPAEALGNDVFSNKIRESIQETQTLLSDCGKFAPGGMVDQHHVLYKSGVIKEGGILRRAVILMVMTKWGEITSPFSPD